MEGGGGADDSNSGSGSKPATSSESAGGRLRFTVELKPGETTIVSWKKLLRDANAGKLSGPGPLTSCPTSEAHHSIPAPAPPLHTASSSKLPCENEAKDSEAQPGSNRLNTVVKRIERMYAGKASGNEDDFGLDDGPDDTELDEYFEVDNLATKHDGYYVNRGKLEHMHAKLSSSEQPKKRKWKDLKKGNCGSDGGHSSNKHIKAGNKGGKALSMDARTSISQSHKVAVPNVQDKDVQMQNPTDVHEVSPKKKAADTKCTVDSSRPLNGDAIRKEKGKDQLRTGVLPLENHGKRLKESNEFIGFSSQRSNHINSYPQSKSQSGTSLNNVDDANQSIPKKVNGDILARPDLNTLLSKNFLQTVNTPIIQRNEGSSSRPRSSLLEEAISELEKMVAESRPPSMEVQDAGNASQVVKRRLPPEIKQKLAKVARLEASHGKISNELITRLMSILGHLVQLRTLKRNLKIMVNMELSAKQEKYDRIQQRKNEVEEMIKMQGLFIKPMALEQQPGNSDDFQEAYPQEKEAPKRKYNIDDALEDKICDLYDLYVEVLEEDSDLPVKKLYAELAALWPNGIMDNHGIKRAVYRAKVRRNALCSQQKVKDQEKIKKNLAPKAEETIRGEASDAAQSLHMQEKLASDSYDLVSTSMHKPFLSTTLADAFRAPVGFANGPKANKPNTEKVKENSSICNDTMTVDVLPKKKDKRKPEMDLVRALDNPTFAQGAERHKHRKKLAVPPTKSYLQPAGPPGFGGVN